MIFNRMGYSFDVGRSHRLQFTAWNFSDAEQCIDLKWCLPETVKMLEHGPEKLSLPPFGKIEFACRIALEFQGAAGEFRHFRLSSDSGKALPLTLPLRPVRLLISGIRSNDLPPILRQDELLQIQTADSRLFLRERERKNEEPGRSAEILRDCRSCRLRLREAGRPDRFLQKSRISATGAGDPVIELDLSECGWEAPAEKPFELKLEEFPCQYLIVQEEKA